MQYFPQHSDLLTQDLLPDRWYLINLNIFITHNHVLIHQLHLLPSLPACLPLSLCLISPCLCTLPPLVRTTISGRSLSYGTQVEGAGLHSMYLLVPIHPQSVVNYRLRLSGRLSSSVASSTHQLIYQPSAKVQSQAPKG